jgi:hypothetical protein
VADDVLLDDGGRQLVDVDSIVGIVLDQVVPGRAATVGVIDGIDLLNDVVVQAKTTLPPLPWMVVWSIRSGSPVTWNSEARVIVFPEMTTSSK